ncbi:hypothetical protein [Bacteroides sp. 41_26]|uniref:hypothetical protein n=1 Tax=Bacteroides sp. 41_26 TaxID=1896973 RepID=UPI00259C97EB|nr:hypothetical protein [Bacteroides sp. 41_26]
MNIKTGKIHNGLSPCARARKMGDGNKKWFETYADAENFYESDTHKGVFCGVCFTSREEALNLEQKNNK